MKFFRDEYLNTWNYQLNKESVAAGFYVMMEKEIIFEASKLFIPESIKGLVSMQLSKVIERLVYPNNYFNNNPKEQRDQFLIKCFEQAFSKMSTKFKNPVTDKIDYSLWKYGQANYKHIRFEHPLAHLIDAKSKQKLNLGPLPRGGNGYTVGSTGSAENQSSGASFRVLMDTKNWDHTLMINTPGQSGDYKSPYYGNLFSTWANDAYFPAYFSKLLIEQNSATITILKKN
jgi:penicillin amidase